VNTLALSAIRSTPLTKSVIRSAWTSASAVSKTKRSARTAGQPVRPVTTAERVVARPAGDRVVARQSRQRLAAEIAGDLVVAAGRHQHLGANRRGRPDAAVGKGKLLDLPVEAEITEGVVEEVADANPVARRAGETHHQVVAGARDADFRRPDADVELQRIDLTNGSPKS
jgi:hypothetical protein